jgi:hypothetical protein
MLFISIFSSFFSNDLFSFVWKQSWLSHALGARTFFISVKTVDVFSTILQLEKGCLETWNCPTLCHPIFFGLRDAQFRETAPSQFSGQSSAQFFVGLFPEVNFTTPSWAEALLDTSLVWPGRFEVLPLPVLLPACSTQCTRSRRRSLTTSRVHG